jgi:hypothetical protein
VAEWARASGRGILLKLRLRVAEWCALDLSRVVVTVLDPSETPRTTAQQDILLRPGGEDSLEGILDGSGRYDDRRTRSLELSVRTRVQLDQAGQDLTRLTDASLGHVQMEDRLIDGLQNYQVPGDGSDVWTAPLRLTRLSQPQRLKGDIDWVSSTFTAHYEYTRDLDTAAFV